MAAKIMAASAAKLFRANKHAGKAPPPLFSDPPNKNFGSRRRP
jgi:hypothetical protein